ncbi:hypothetical protein C2845_PM03G09410 [Panicum miliaceum]|uniref:Uncharacterized protein n=1 Tax=Panicum miliaceum TaxID=4540 RepID=A0A3L6T896_PANMI|nr:hypothetical protein C2845_PM03G09410 [Panicum miliaceum]
MAYQDDDEPTEAAEPWRASSDSDYPLKAQRDELRLGSLREITLSGFMGNWGRSRRYGGGRGHPVGSRSRAGAGAREGNDLAVPPARARCGGERHAAAVRVDVRVACPAAAARWRRGSLSPEGAGKPAQVRAFLCLDQNEFEQAFSVCIVIWAGPYY